MDLLAAINREERKLEKELAKLQGKLSSLRAATKALGNSAVRETKQVKRRVLSAAGRARISKAAKARWAKIRAQAKRLAS
jgi:predicted transcriptional regulator